MSLFPLLHVRQDFFNQSYQPKEVGVHDSLHLIEGLTLNGSNQAHPSITYCHRNPIIAWLCVLFMEALLFCDSSLKKTPTHWGCPPCAQVNCPYRLWWSPHSRRPAAWSPRFCPESGPLLRSAARPCSCSSWWHRLQDENGKTEVN